jgi:hypothetical protein
MEEIAANEWAMETLEVDNIHCRAILNGKVPSKVSQLALGDFGDKLGLAVLCRPHSVLFFHVDEENFSSLVFDTIPPSMGDEVVRF